MIERFLFFLSGYVLLSVKGSQTERFLNLCRSRKIPIRRIHFISESEITFILSLKDFFRMRPIRSKTGVHIRILKKYGLPFFFYRNKKRKAFFLGAFLCACIMVTLSLRIWNIHIEGNIRNSTPEILQFLEKNGITHGMAKKDVNCYGIAAMVRKEYPEVTWVSARIEGTRLILTMQEGIVSEQILENSSPCNLVAENDGMIVEMITRSGIPLKKPGDTCEKGEVLVSGELHIMNDSQEIVRYEYVHSDADIYISRSLSYYHEFPLEYESQIPTGEKKRGIFLKAGSFCLNLYAKTDKNWRRTTQEYPLRLTENFVLPFAMGTVSLEKYQTIRSTYTKGQAEELALARLHLYEEKLMEKGVQISENNVTIEVNSTACISKGSLKIIEKTGRETDVMQQEQPTERTAQDG